MKVIAHHEILFCGIGRSDQNITQSLINLFGFYSSKLDGGFETEHLEKQD